MRRLLLAPLAVAALATGCSTFDTDVVARVADSELTSDGLDDLTGALATDSPEGDAGVARQVIGFWARIEAVKWAFERDGIEVTDDDRAAAAESLSDPAAFPDFDVLGADVQAELADWQATLDVLGDDLEYGQQAVAEADTWVSGRYGQVSPDGSGEIVALALPTAAPTG
jgi:hypothetical protein